MGICELSLRELSSQLAKRKLSAAEVLEAHLARVRTCDPALHSFVTLNEAECAELVRGELREPRGREDAGALRGVPVAVKDNICTKGLRTTCASRILKDYVPPYDATAVARLRHAGCLLIG